MMSSPRLRQQPASVSRAISAIASTSFMWNGVETPSDDVRRILVGIKEQAVAYADLTNILLRQNGTWEHSLPPH